MDAAKETGVSEGNSVSEETGTSAVRWILIALVVIVLVLFIAWARREPGFDDRIPDPEDAVSAASALVIAADRGGL
jgi:hypothetical protein